MDGEWSEDTFASFQPPQPEFSLPTTIVSQVPALACSDTTDLSPNSLFLLKQHNFRISLTISYFNNATFLFLVPSPVLPNITDPTPRQLPSDLLIAPLRVSTILTLPPPAVTHLHLSLHSPGGLCLNSLITDPPILLRPSQMLTILKQAKDIPSWPCPPYL